MTERILEIDINMGALPFWEMVLRLAVATILGGLVGLERERLERAAGLRTHALVSVASALMMVVSTYGFPSMIDGVAVGLDPSRLAAQVVSGIGFLGAGVIIFRENSVRGLTTAATVWAVAGVGLAAGGGLFALAIVGTGFMLLVQAGLKPVERKFFARHARQHRVVLDVAHGVDVLEDIKRALADTAVRLRSLQFDQSSRSGSDVVELTLMAEDQGDILELITRLRASETIQRISYQRGSSRVQGRERLNEQRGDGTDDEEDDAEP
jgi:putative Mg2+ transporter-C (MgtC) family protein